MDERAVMKTAKERIKDWLKDPYDPKTRSEVKKLMTNEEEVKKHFGSSIQFGTAGMRGPMGVGTSYINLYTIRTATQGLANYIHKFDKKNGSYKVAISYDSRHHSKEFAEETAKVLAANNIDVYLTKELRSTPFASYACRHFNCIAAVMITASHNPPEDNGYKVYWEDGAQVVSPHDSGIIDEVMKIESIDSIKLTKLSNPHIHYIEKDLDDQYLKEVSTIAFHPEVNKKDGKELSVVYSSLNGCGITLIPRSMRNWGFTNLFIVQEQEIPDGDFPTCPIPNPEKPEALKLAIRDLLKKKADIANVSDPDADRMSTTVRHHGEARILSGNELGSLLLYYILSSHKQRGSLPSNGAVVTTIVSTPIVGEIAKSFGIECFEVLTGFKYIGEKILEWEGGKHTFLFGMEESLGYLVGDFVRDKDATQAASLVCEMALQLKKAGKTLVDELEEIYKKYGVFREAQRSLVCKEGHEKMLSLMQNVRADPPTKLCGQDVAKYEDLMLGKNLPKANVLAFHLADKSTFYVRPSGTEPKIKIYGQMRREVIGNIELECEELSNELEKRLQSIERTLFSPDLN